MALKRFVHGAEGDFFFQKRAPSSRPDWIETVELSFPSGRTAEEIVVRDAAQLAWIVNLGCIDLNPHPVRADDLDHPDELRVDLDPVPGIEWPQIRDVAMVTKEVLETFGLVGWPKTRLAGIHVYAARTPLDVPRGPTGGARARARGRTAHTGPRHQSVVEGRAPRRLPRLQPEREGPNRRLRVLDPPDPRRARVGAARVGRGSRGRAGRVHDRHRAEAILEIGDPSEGIDEAVGRSGRSSSSPNSTSRPGSATRPGHRSTPSRRGAGPRAAVEAPARHPAEGRHRAHPRRGRRPARRAADAPRRP